MDHNFLFLLKKCRHAAALSVKRYYLLSLLLSHFWLAMPQEVLQADWQEVWHSPQPPFFALSQRLRVSIVLICFIVNIPPNFYSINYTTNISASQHFIIKNLLFVVAVIALGHVRVSGTSVFAADSHYHRYDCGDRGRTDKRINKDHAEGDSFVFDQFNVRDLV